MKSNSYPLLSLLLLLLLLSRFSRVRLCATPQTAATRLPRPWDSPGKNIGVGCHFLLQCMKVKSASEVAEYQAPLSMGFSRQEYWSGLPLPSLLKIIIVCLNTDIYKQIKIQILIFIYLYDYASS